MICSLLLTALIAVTDTRPAAPNPIAKNVLIELFTSQGCSSCPPAAPELIFAATFLSESTTRVIDGENAGRSIQQVNIVRALSDPVPFRTGKLPATAEFTLPFSSGENIAVWIQDYKTLAVDHAEIWRGH